MSASGDGIANFKIYFLLAILVSLGVMFLGPFGRILILIGLALPTIFWVYDTRQQKNRKYPVIILRITAAEVIISLLAAVPFLLSLQPLEFLGMIAAFSLFFGWLNLVGGVIFFYRRSQIKKGKVQRGTELTVDTEKLQLDLDQKHQEFLTKRSAPEVLPRFSIGSIQLPAYLENLGIFAVGSPGSGKSQAISQLLCELKQRPDFRVVCFDRNGEFTESFYNESKDLIFNPTDARTVNWSHKVEQARPETIAAALVPDNHKEPFFSDAARSLLSDLYERCDDNAEIWGALAGLSVEEFKDFVKGGISHRYFISEKTGGSVLSSLINYARFYSN